MSTEANTEDAGTEVSHLRDLYDVVTLTIHFRGEGGALVSRDLRFAHKQIDADLWARLEAIEAEESDTPADVRQLVALDTFSPDLAEGGRPAELTAAVLARFGELFRSRLVGAIVPNALSAAAAARGGQAPGAPAQAATRPPAVRAARPRKSAGQGAK